MDEIIEELHTYENALQTMGKSIGDISTIVKTNEGKSIEAWDHDLTTSKDEIKNYQEQVSDLLSLFENYVIDTTAYISPLARGTMMRVSRNDIWANLQQINTGFSGNVANALVTTYKQPNSFLFGLLDDPSDAEQDASDHNRIQLEGIQENIQSSQSVLEEKMEDLMGLYNQKVKPFENTDDAYKDLAADVKKKYTSFFEGVKELLETMDQIQIDLVKGFVNGLIGLVAGVATIAWDVGVVSVSAIIPDPIEPTFLRNKADETFDEYKEAAIQLVQDPMSVVELVAQTVNDTIEHEGIPYLTGETLTAFIPASMGVKVVKGASKLKGPGKKNVNNSFYSKEFYQGKIDAAKAGLADVKVPVFTKEKLSTGSTEIPAFGMESKRLSEVYPQMFKGKGDGGKKANGAKYEITWNKHINPTQEVITNTNIPKSFTLEGKTVNGKDVWVHGNATKHMGEFINSSKKSIITENELMLSFQDSVSLILPKVKPGRNFFNINGWEIGINGDTGVIYHALYKS